MTSLSEEVTKPGTIDPVIARHAAIGALTLKFYEELGPFKRSMIDAHLPFDLRELLRESVAK